MQLRLFPKQIICQSYSRFKSFSLIQYDLWILWNVFLMEMFDLRGTGGHEMKYTKELLLNHYR